MISVKTCAKFPPTGFTGRHRKRAFLRRCGFKNYISLELDKQIKMYLPGCCFECDITEESPKDAFIAILRSLSERSDQYFYGLNALKDDGFGIHLLLDMQWQQMRKIFKVFQYADRMGEVSGDGMGRLCDDIGRELCQLSSHRLQRTTKKESKLTEQWWQHLHFIRLGQRTPAGEMRKAGEQ